MRLSKIKSTATSFLDGYKNENPASFAAAQQAVGGLLILDGFIGIDNPFGGKKRSGIFGSLIGVIVGLAFIFGSGFIGGIFGTKSMTAETTATVESVSQQPRSNTNNSNNTSNSCTAVAKYTVDGKEYSQQSSFGSSGICSLAPGQTVAIKYNPNQPGSWGYGVDTVNNVIKFIPIFGILVFLVSLITFGIRLLSIIFGWKLLTSGRALAKTLPEGTNLGTVTDEIKQNFSKLLFGGQIEPSAPQPPTPTQDNTPPADSPSSPTQVIPPSV